MSMEFYAPLMPVIIYTTAGCINFFTLSGSFDSDVHSAAVAQATQ